MIKKQYMKPEQKVVKLRARHTLLSGSVRGLDGFGGRAANNDTEDDYGD